jgi:hypothetical protein
VPTAGVCRLAFVALVGEEAELLDLRRDDREPFVELVEPVDVAAAFDALAVFFEVPVEKPGVNEPDPKPRANPWWPP